MKRIIIVFLLCAWNWGVGAEFDPGRVMDIAIRLDAADGMEVSPYPLLVGESTVASVTATLNDGSTGVPVPGEFVTIASQNTNVVQTGPGLELRAVGFGAANVLFQVGYAGRLKAITAVLPAARLVHRYSFEGAAEGGVVADSVGGAHGWLTNDVTGGSTPILTNGEARFDGQGGYVGLPAGLASRFTNLSLAVWVTTNASRGDRTNPVVTTRLLDFAVVSNEPPVRVGGLALEISPISLRAKWGSLTQDVVVSWWPFGNYATGLVAGLVAPPLTLLGRAPGGQALKGITNLPALNFLADADNRMGGSLEPGFSFKGSLAEVRMYEGLLSAYDLASLQTAGADSAGSVLGELRRVRVAFSPAELELSNAQPARVQVLGDFTGATDVDLLERGLVSLSVVGWPLVATLASSNEVSVIGPGTASLNVYSRVSQTTIASVPLPIAGPQQLRLVLPRKEFSVRDVPVGLSVAGDYLYATNIDLTHHTLTSIGVSDSSVAQVLGGPKLEFLKAGTAWVTASFERATTAVQITVTNPPGFAATFPRLRHRWNFSGTEDGACFSWNYDVVRNVSLIGLSIYVLDEIRPRVYGRSPRLDGGVAHLNWSSSYFEGVWGMEGLSNCTVELWVKCNNPRYYQRIFDVFQPVNPYDSNPYLGHAHPLAGNIYLAPLSQEGSGGVVAKFAPAEVDTNEFYSLEGAAGLPAGAWSHVVWVHSPGLGVAELYVNGEQVAAGQTRAGFWPTSLWSYMWLGRTAGDPDRIFYGDYDDFRVYEGALTPAQVRMNYQAGPDAPLASALALGSRLRALRGSDTQRVRIFVPNPSTGVVLESSPVLGANAVWTVVDAPVQVEGDQTSVEIPVGTRGFFRLRAP